MFLSVSSHPHQKLVVDKKVCTCLYIPSKAPVSILMYQLTQNSKNRRCIISQVVFLKVSLHNQPSCHEGNENLYLTIDSVHGLPLLYQGDSVQLQENVESGLRALHITQDVHSHARLTLTFL